MKSTAIAPGRTTTRSQLQEDINAILRRAFSQMSAQPEDTPLRGNLCGAAQPGST